MALTSRMLLTSGEVSAKVYNAIPLLDHYHDIGLDPEILSDINEFTYAALPEGSHGKFLVRASDAIALTEGAEITLTITGDVETFTHSCLYITKITYHSVPNGTWELDPTEPLDNKFAIIEVQDLWFLFDQTIRVDYNRVSQGDLTPQDGLFSMQDVLDDLATRHPTSGVPTIELSGFPEVKPHNLLFASSTIKDAFNLVADAYFLVCYADKGTSGAGKVKITDSQPVDLFNFSKNQVMYFDYGSEALAARLRVVMSQQSQEDTRTRSLDLDSTYSTYSSSWANSSEALSLPGDSLLENNAGFQNSNLEFSHYFPFYEPTLFGVLGSVYHELVNKLAINLVKRNQRTIDIVLKDVVVQDPCMTVQAVTYKMTHIGLITVFRSWPPKCLSVDPMVNHAARWSSGTTNSGTYFYKSEEDRYRIARYWFWARRCDVQGVVVSGTPYEKVYDWPQAGSRMLINMRAGLLMQVVNIGGTLYYVYGPPPPTSYPPSPAEIYIHGAASPPSASDVFEFEAEVGVAYSKTIDVVGIGSHTSVTASDLPPGISYTQVTYTLSGTPTTEGVYFIKFTGAATGGNAIRLLKLTVLPSGGGGGGGGGPGGPIEEP